MQVVLTYTRTRKSIHVKRNTKKRMAMSKEKHATWRAFRKQNETVMNNAAPRVTDAPEDAMHTIWNSERKVMVDGKWYIPISEVSEILTTPSEENSNQWLRNMVEIEPNDMELGGRVREAYWKERNRE